MRLAIISDVHGNLPALEAALEVLDREGVDEMVCLGDLVGYGPQPNEVVALVQERAIPTVVGNHDLVAAGIDPIERSGSSARATLTWTRAAISDGTRAFLTSLPRKLELIDGRVVAAHGSIDDPWNYVRRVPDALEQLDELRRTGSASILLLGHTHRQMAVDVRTGRIATSEWIRGRARRELQIAGPTFVNPGALGQSREPRAVARCALLDLSARKVTLYALHYADDANKERLRALGLPPEWCHARPPMKKVIRQVLRDAEDRRTDVRSSEIAEP